MAHLSADGNQAIGSSPSSFSAMDALAARSFDAVLLISRILLGWLFFITGWGKLMNPGGTAKYFAFLGMPAPDLWVWPALIVELAVGIALILGIATRYAAIVTFLFTLVATLIAHRYWGYPEAQQLNQYNHFLKNLAIMGGALLVFAVGAGRYSLDARMRRGNG